MASTTRSQQPLTFIDNLSHIWKPLPIVLGVLILLIFIFASYFVRILAVKLTKRCITDNVRTKFLPRQLVLPTVYDAQRAATPKRPSRISAFFASLSITFLSTALCAYTRIKATSQWIGSLASTMATLPTRAFASVGARPFVASARASVCKVASYFAMGKYTRTMYRVPPMPAAYGDSEAMKAVWKESWPLMRAQDRQERKATFVYLSRATFAGFVDSAASWARAPFADVRRSFEAEKSLPAFSQGSVVIDEPMTPPPSYTSQASDSAVPAFWWNADELRPPVIPDAPLAAGIAIPPKAYHSMRTKDGFVSEKGFQYLSAIV